MPDVTGVVITGAYGTGKTSVVEEIAYLLDSAGFSYGAIDLDWLWWFDAEGVNDATARDVLQANLSSIVHNYIASGVERFVMAGAIVDEVHLAALRESVPFPLRVVHLTLALDEIEARLGPAVTAGRRDDLQEAARWLAEGVGTGIGDVEIATDRPIRDVATEILGWLGWQ